MKKGSVILSVALSLTSCSGNKEQIVKDVCIPINENDGLSLERIATDKKYNVDEVRRVCRQYVKDQVKETEENMKKLGL